MFEAATMALPAMRRGAWWTVRKLIRRQALGRRYQALAIDFRVIDYKATLFQHRARRNWVAS